MPSAYEDNQQIRMLESLKHQLETNENDIERNCDEFLSFSRNISEKLLEVGEDARIRQDETISGTITALRQQLNEAVIEKELMKKENDLLEENNKKLVQNSNTKFFTKDIEEYINVIQILEEETKRLRNQLKNSFEINEKFFRENDLMKNDITTLENEVKILQKQNSKLENEQSNEKNRFDNFQEKYFTQESKLKELENVMSGVNLKLEQAQNKVKESIKIAEDACLEKEKAILRERQAIDQCHDMEKKLEAKNHEKFFTDVENETKDLSENLRKELNESEVELQKKTMELEEVKRKFEKTTQNHQDLKNSLLKLQQNERAQLVEFDAKIKELEEKLLKERKINENSEDVFNNFKIGAQKVIQKQKIGISQLQADLMQQKDEKNQIRTEKNFVIENLKSEIEKIKKLNEYDDHSRNDLSAANPSKVNLNAGTCKTCRNEWIKNERTLNHAEKDSIASKLNETIHILNSKISSLQTSNASLNAKYDEKKSDFQKHAKFCENRYFTLLMQKQNFELQNTALVEERSRSKEKLADLQQEIQDYKKLNEM